MRQPTSTSRRTALASALCGALLSAPQAAITGPVSAAEQLPAASLAAELLALIPSMEFGAPATNATVPPALSRKIEARAAAVERQAARDNAKDPRLSDSWRLIYSNGREITNLATGLPLGFVLGKTYQPVDVQTGRFENQGLVEHRLGLARASTLVIGDMRLAPPGTLNAAGTRNERGNRVDVDFRRLTFGLDAVLGKPLETPLRKVVVTRQNPDAAQPANDVTYLDATCRITRGGDDALFIFVRERGNRPMLSLEEREALFAEGGAAITTGSGDADLQKGAPPELKALLREERRDRVEPIASSRVLR